MEKPFHQNNPKRWHVGEICTVNQLAMSRFIIDFGDRLDGHFWEKAFTQNPKPARRFPPLPIRTQVQTANNIANQLITEWLPSR